MNSNLGDKVRFEIARAKAGNTLFCPGMHAFADRSDRPVLYNEAAHLLRLLLSADLTLTGCRDYHVTIRLMARVMGTAVKCGASHTDVGEYVLFLLAGVPGSSDGRMRRKHEAMIGTFFANLSAEARCAALNWKSEADRIFENIRIT